MPTTPQVVLEREVFLSNAVHSTGSTNGRLYFRIYLFLRVSAFRVHWRIFFKYFTEGLLLLSYLVGKILKPHVLKRASVKCFFYPKSSSPAPKSSSPAPKSSSPAPKSSSGVDPPPDNLSPSSNF